MPPHKNPTRAGQLSCFEACLGCHGAPHHVQLALHYLAAAAVANATTRRTQQRLAATAFASVTTPAIQQCQVLQLLGCLVGVPEACGGCDAIVIDGPELIRRQPAGQEGDLEHRMQNTAGASVIPSNCAALQNVHARLRDHEVLEESPYKYEVNWSLTPSPRW